MTNVISSSALLNKLHDQYRILRPIENNEDPEVAKVYDDVRDRLASLLKGKELSNEKELTDLCLTISHSLKELFSKEKSSSQQKLNRRTLSEIIHNIHNARTFTKKQLLRESGWEEGKEDHIANVVNNLRRILNVDPLEEKKTWEQQLEEIPESERQSYQYMVEDLGLDPAILSHLLCVIHPDKFSWGQEGNIDSVSGWIGKFERKIEPGVLNLPPQIFIEPKVAWFRKILFNQLRDKYFEHFNQPRGLKAVHREIHKELQQLNDGEKEKIALVKDKKSQEDIRIEFAIKRRFLSALSLYFEELENMPHPARLKNSLAGDEPFPNRYQQVAVHETAQLKRFFNAGEMGSGKTGAAIASFEHLNEQEDEEKPKAERALILCPANVVKVWQNRLSDSEEGYFRKGQMKPGDIVVISGDPRNRRKLLEQAKHARYVIIGIEMSRSETDSISHEDWINAIGADFLIIDEVHNVRKMKGADTSDTERIYRLSQSPNIKYRVLLSGTPIPNHRHDLAAQLRLLHAKSEDQKLGKHEYETIDAFEAFLNSAPISSADKKILSEHDRQKDRDTNGIISVNFHSLKEIASMIQGCDVPITQHYLLPFLYRPSASDSLPVHSKLHPVIEDVYDLTPYERREYNKVLEDEALGLLQKVHKLHRICLHSEAIPGRIRTGESKSRQIKYWVDTFLKQKNHSGKIVIASPHYAQGVTKEIKDNKECEIIAQELESTYADRNVPIFVLDGRQETKSNLNSFQQHKGAAILLVQMDTVREGIDLSDAARAILLSPDWAIPNEDQFWRRFYRRGQKFDVQCVKLVARNTIEQGMNIIGKQKLELGERLLNGRILTKDELELLDVGGGGKANPYMWWAMLPPKERLSVLWGQLMHKGTTHLQNTMERWGKEFADLYDLDWETSYNGNVARLVGAAIEQWKKNHAPEKNKRKYDIADIASGAFAIERTLMDKKDNRVWSSDINPAMISPEIGARVLGKAFDPKRTDVAAMEKLPYKAESMDLAVLSLGLHYSMHREQPEKAGKERIRTMLELNRILKSNGGAVVTLPPSIFRGRIKEKYKELCESFRYFGFAVIPELSCRATAKIKDDEKKFESYIFTLRKVGKPIIDLKASWKDIPKPIRDGLDLSKKQKAGGLGRKKRGGRRNKSPSDEHGSYIDAFTLDGNGFENDLEFEISDSQQSLKEKVERKDRAMQRSHVLVQQLLTEYQTIDSVPPERWLDLSLDAIMQSPKEIQDAYADALLTKSTREKLKPLLQQISLEQKTSMARVRSRNGQDELMLTKVGDDGRRKHRRYPLER